ncbi:MAG TPA: endonuclease domain-containing protein [Bauldia sp.]|nr:endonuclease domain-containing protein [Bauldia sp.]
MRAPTLTFKRARAQRRQMSLPEVLLWQALRGGALSAFRFRRQHPVGPYVLDFHCSSHRLGVEVDGSVHDLAGQAARDRVRDQWLRQNAVRVLRFPARDVLHEASRRDVIATIRAALAPSTAFGGPPPP